MGLVPHSQTMTDPLNVARVIGDSVPPGGPGVRASERAQLWRNDILRALGGARGIEGVFRDIKFVI